MHPALQIEEILLNIFGYCSNNCYGTTIPDMARVARTCRTFKEPALDILWAELSDLSPLARCLPETSHQLSTVQVKSVDSVYSFSGPLSQTDWDILRRYTPRIRSIHDFGTGLDQKSLSILSNAPITEPLFPNLRAMRWTYDVDSAHLLHIPFPSLVFLSIRFEKPIAPDNFFESLPTLVPDIKDIFFDVAKADFEFHESVSSCICRWQNLRSLICPQIVLNADTLVHLSRMPALTLLDFELTGALPVLDSTICFSNLHDAALRSELLDPISRLLCQIRLPAITDFTVIISTYPSTEELLFLLSSIQTSSACSTITHLALYQSSCEIGFETLESLLMGLEDLQPCMAFSNLVYFKFDMECNVGLTDSDLLTLTSAWPHLEHLLINAACGWGTTGGITPNGLVELLRTCRSLTETALVIDARDYVEFRPPSTPRFALSPSFHINILDSVLEAESVPALAAFFADIMASCPGFTYLYMKCNMPPWDWKVYEERWDEVFRRADEAAHCS